MTSVRPIDHAEALDRAALYVLDALEPDEAAEVTAHLSTCPEPHPHFAELGSVVRHLPRTLEPVEPPADLRARVIEAIRADAKRSGTPAVPPRIVAREGATSRPLDWRRMLLPLAAAFAIVAVTAWNLALQQQLGQAAAREAALRQAVTAMTTPGATLSRLDGAGSARGATGYAAFAPGRRGSLVIQGLPPAPPGKAYQAWFVTNEGPRSAGLMAQQADGLSVLTGLEAPTGTDAIAVTLETDRGADRPTSEPVVQGRLGT